MKRRSEIFDKKQKFSVSGNLEKIENKSSRKDVNRSILHKTFLIYSNNFHCFTRFGNFQWAFPFIKFQILRLDYFFLSLYQDEATSLLKKLFEGRSSKEPSELLVKAAAEGDVEQINQLCNSGAAKVKEKNLFL